MSLCSTCSCYTPVKGWLENDTLEVIRAFLPSHTRYANEGKPRKLPPRGVQAKQSIEE